MQTQFKNSSEISIKRYAFNEVKKLIFCSIALCFTATFIYSTYSSIYKKHLEISHLAELIGKTSGKSILIGGDYLPKSWVQGLVQSAGISSVWIKSNDITIAEGHSRDGAYTFDEIQNKRILYKYNILNLIETRKVFYNKQEIATLYIISPLDIYPILSMSLSTSLIVSLFLAIIFFYVRRMAEEISTPLFEFSKHIESKISKNAFSKDASVRKWKFKEINHIQKTVIEYFLKAKETERLALQEVSTAQLSKIFRVAKHDITASLGLGESQLSRIKEHDKVTSAIKSVFNRIYDIIQNIPNSTLLTLNEIDDILERNQTKENDESQPHLEKSRTILLLSQLKTITNEMMFSKQTQNKSIDFQFDYAQEIADIYIDVEPIQFQRSLINIYKNALEAIPKNGIIKSRITINDNTVMLEIIDTGRGISIENLSKIGKQGFTYGKDKGTGLGLSTAIEAVKRWSGQLVIDSPEMRGTTVRISLPIAEPEYLYPSNLILSKGVTLISIDDDPSIHTILKQKLSDLVHTQKINEVIYLTGSSKLSEKIQILESANKDFIVLMDQNIRGEDLKGIELIKKYKIENNSLILSSNAHFDSLFFDCKALDVPILSKALLPEIDVVIV
jgi:signal transduction histidine kinase